MSGEQQPLEMRLPMLLDWMYSVSAVSSYKHSWKCIFDVATLAIGSK